MINPGIGFDRGIIYKLFHTDVINIITFGYSEFPSISLKQLKCIIQNLNYLFWCLFFLYNITKIQISLHIGILSCSKNQCLYNLPFFLIERNILIRVIKMK